MSNTHADQSNNSQTNRKIKVGILTFHNAINYGAVLQAFALCKTINRLHNFNCSVINYNNRFFEKQYLGPIHLCMHEGFLQKAKYIIKRIIRPAEWKNYKKKILSIQRFIAQYIPLSREYYVEDIHESNDEFDKFVVGSDQVWFLALSNYDINYLLNFVDRKKAKISYAASVGKGYLTGYEIDNLKLALKSFRAVSMREKSGIDLISKYCDFNKSVQVLDPTLLLSKDEWIEIAEKSKIKTKNRYILVYCVQPPSKFFVNKINEYASKNNLEVLSLSKIIGLKAKDMSYSSIEDFVYLFSNSEVVFATSFHALVFASIFQKTFFYENNDNVSNTNARYKDLCDYLNVGDRCLSNTKSIPGFIDWQLVEKTIEIHRKESINFLKDALK